MTQKTKFTAKRICIAAVFMALNIALSSFGVPVPGGHLYLCDIAICTAAILLDPISAFAVGGIGSFLGDLFFYPAPMFVSLVVHGVQAVVISVFAHYTFKKKQIIGIIIGLILGSIIMVVGYTLGKIYVYSTLEYAIMKIPYEIAQAVIGVIVSLIVHFALKPMKKVRKFIEE